MSAEPNRLCLFVLPMRSCRTPDGPKWALTGRSPFNCRHSVLGDLVFREDLLDPLECLLCGHLRGHLVFHDFGPGGLPHMLVLDLGIGRIRGPEGRYRGAEQTLPSVRRPVGVRELPRVVFHDRRHCRKIAAQSRLQ